MAIRPFDLKDFGLRLIEARGVRTQDDVAQKLGIDQSLYSKYERGKREMPLRLVIPFCDLCGCEVDWLVTGAAKRAQVSRKTMKERAA